MPISKERAKERAAKVKAMLLKRFGQDYYQRIGKKGGSAHQHGGFGSRNIGRDGLTGRQRAIVSGAAGGKAKKRNFDKRKANE